MEEKEFKGNIKTISPRLLVPSEDDQFAEFFLSLGLVFNDLKGLMELDQILRGSYRPPKTGELTSHSGEYTGIRLQIYKLLVGIMNEFLDLIKENKKVIGHPKFLLLVNEMSKKDQGLWNSIKGEVFGQNKKDNFGKMIDQVRNNVAHHYKQSGRVLSQGFHNFFDGSKVSDNNKHAYYAIGDDMAETRFYFVDAALEKYIDMKLHTTTEHKEKFMELISSMNHVIANLLRVYIQKLKTKR